MVKQSILTKTILAGVFACLVSTFAQGGTIGEFLNAAKNTWGESAGKLLDEAMHDIGARIDVERAGCNIGLYAYVFSRLISEHVHDGGILQYATEKISQKTGISQKNSRMIAGVGALATLILSIVLLPQFVLHNWGARLNITTSPETVAHLNKTGLISGISWGVFFGYVMEYLVAGHIFESKKLEDIEIRKAVLLGGSGSLISSMIYEIIKTIKNIKVPTAAAVSV